MLPSIKLLVFVAWKYGYLVANWIHPRVADFKCWWKLHSRILLFAINCGQSKTTLIFKCATSNLSPMFFFNVSRTVVQKIPLKSIIGMTCSATQSNKLISLSICRLSSKEDFWWTREKNIFDKLWPL